MECSPYPPTLGLKKAVSHRERGRERERRRERERESEREGRRQNIMEYDQ